MKRLLGGAAGAVAGVLPVVACPACWPLYASVLSSLGVGFVGSRTGHAVTVFLLLSISIGVLAVDALRYRRIGPLAIGVVGAAAVVAASTPGLSSPVAYGGSAMLVSAAVWNNRHRGKTPATGRCATDNACSS